MRTIQTLALTSILIPSAALAKSAHDHDLVDHVLLVSVAGLHALDVARFVESHPHSEEADLRRERSLDRV